MDNLFDIAMEIIMEDWNWRPYERSECKFCGHEYNLPSVEKHWEHCPRLIWAIANDDTPSKRVNRRFPGKSWDNDHEFVKYYRGPYLYNDGPKVLGILADAYPKIYKVHFDAYRQMYNEYKKQAAV